MENMTYRSLQEFSGSDFQIVNDEPDIIGWEVKNEKGTFIGKVVELLFDPQTLAVRYFIADLTGNGMNLDGKKVMIPLGIAHLHGSDDEVVLPALHVDQYQALPAYDKEQLGPELEVHIREVIGSPAALRMEDTITDFDQSNFYDHHHFDRGRFYRRDKIPAGQNSEAAFAGQQDEPVPVPEHMMHVPGEVPPPVPGRMSDRSEEQQTIHRLIDGSEPLHGQTDTSDGGSSRS